MSIPSDVLERRRQKYLDASNKTAITDESLESVLARLAIYEQDEKLAQKLAIELADETYGDTSMIIPPPKDSMID